MRSEFQLFKTNSYMLKKLQTKYPKTKRQIKLGEKPIIQCNPKKQSVNQEH